jgi:hypothetical protein
LPDQAVSRLSFYPEAHYAVRRERSWKKRVWRIASAPPRPATPRRCVMPSARRWTTPTIRVGARATPAPPAAATSWSWSITTAPRTTGRWLASSSATCASTTTCRSATSGQPATCRRQAWCATCWTRHSTRFDPSRRRSRSAATRRRGWTFFVVFPASTSKVRNTAARITGPSGAGIVCALVKTSVAASRRPLSRRARHGHRAHLPRRLRWVGTARSAAHARVAVDRHLAAHARVAAHHRPVVHGQAARVALLRVVRDQAARVARIARAAHPDQPIQAEGFTPRCSRRGGS